MQRINGISGRSDNLHAVVTVKDSMDKNRKLKLGIYIGLACLFVITIVFITQYGIIFFNSDTASINLYVREEIKEHAYFPHNWNSGYEILIFTPHTVMIPLTLLGLPAYSCRLVADVIIAVVLTVVLYLLGKNVLSDKVMAAMVALIAFSNYSEDFLVFLDCQASYSIIIIVCSLTILFLLRSMDDSMRVISRGRFILFMAAVTFCAFNGVRYIVVISIPLMLAIAFVSLSGKEPALRQAGKIIAGGIALPTVIGYSCYTALCASLNGWNVNELTFTSLDRLDNSFRIAVKSFLALSGFKTGQAEFSPRYLLMILSSGSFILMTVVFPLLLLFYYKRMASKEKMLYIFSVANFIITTGAMVCTSVVSTLEVGRYYLVPSVFLWIQGCKFIQYLYNDRRHIVSAVTVSAIVGVLLIHSLVVVSDYSAMRDMVNNRYDEVISCIREEGLDFGYASFWNSHIYTVVSDYGTEIAPVNLKKKKIKPFNLLTPTDYYKEDYHKGSSFLLLTKQEAAEKADRYDFLKTSRKKIDINDYYLYVFDYNLSSSLE